MRALLGILEEAQAFLGSLRKERAMMNFLWCYDIGGLCICLNMVLEDLERILVA